MAHILPLNRIAHFLQVAQEPSPMMHREFGCYFHFLLGGWRHNRVYSKIADNERLELLNSSCQLQT
ncbi:hypothetical protein A4U98_00480 [Bifidobacterium animalis subsp. animalis]|nr:hypothetical protein A4U98_00480 [Bifidobacterium animalis subsp. animalis]PHQ53728.1 hypothetical protein ADH71_005735 [Bifidobacterium animalis subsp. animalis]